MGRGTRALIFRGTRSFRQTDPNEINPRNERAWRLDALSRDDGLERGGLAADNIPRASTGTFTRINKRGFRPKKSTAKDYLCGSGTYINLCIGSFKIH